LGGGESGPSLRAFPFCAAENLLTGVMGALARRWSEEEDEETRGKKMKMGWGLRPLSHL
jgi:hypothetical protein